MTDSSITLHSSGAISYDGPEAVDLYRAKTLASALKMYARSGIIPTRGVTITVMLRMATGYTRKAYKRGDALKASEDVKVWADTLMAAMPIREA